MEVVSAKESCEKEVVGDRMSEDEFNKQHNRFGRLVTFNDQLYIGPLTYEINALESMVRYYQQQEKSLEKKLTESYAENRKLRDRRYSLFDMMRSQSGSDPATTESTHRNITILPNPNECVQTWEDLFPFFNKNSNVPKSTKESAGSPQSDVGQKSCDPVGPQVVSEEVVTEQVWTKSLLFVSLSIFAAFALLYFELVTIAV